MEDLKNIIRECAAGKPQAQEALYQKYAPKMFGVCLRYARDRAEAEDNLQEGFVKVFTHIHKFRHEGSLEGWVRKIMVNVSLEKIRKQNMVYPVEDVAIYDSHNLSDDVIEKITADELLALVQELSPRYRMVFNLYVIEGMSHQDISEAMGISIGTSKSNLARAREILKRKIVTLYSFEKKSNYSV